MDRTAQNFRRMPGDYYVWRRCSFIAAATMLVYACGRAAGCSRDTTSVGAADSGIASVGGTWRKMTPVAHPPARHDSPLVFDTARGEALLFGGSATNGGARVVFNDTWRWDGTNWSRATSATAPPPRAAHALAFDSKRGVAVLFGGADDAGRPMHDTWEWDGIDWQRREFPIDPGVHVSASMAFDSRRGVTVLHGGCQISSEVCIGLIDTWEYDGHAWIDRSPTNRRPFARTRSAMAYDPTRGVTVLFGGMGNPMDLSDTWEWDGQQWSARATTSGPRPTFGHSLVYDAARRVIVLFGGTDDSGTAREAAWSWNGDSWIRLTTSGAEPSARSRHGMTMDDRRGVAVLFGGRSIDGSRDLDDTWEWSAR
jgi:hypothetical protein